MMAGLEEELDVIERHSEILTHIAKNQPEGIIKTSQKLGYPKHKVRNSRRTLERYGLIEPTQKGAETTDKAPEYVSSYNRRLEELSDRLENKL